MTDWLLTKEVMGLGSGRYVFRTKVLSLVDAITKTLQQLLSTSFHFLRSYVQSTQGDPGSVQQTFSRAVRQCTAKPCRCLLRHPGGYLRRQHAGSA